MMAFRIIIAAALALLLTSCSEEPTKPEDSPTYITTPSGLMYRDVKIGNGRSPKRGETAVVDYTVWLMDGTKIDSSHDRGVPFTFPVGMGSVIPGFDEGVASMRVGGIRRLRVPPELAYGEDGYPPIIPPNSALDCEIELLQVRGHETLPD